MNWAQSLERAEVVFAEMPEQDQSALPRNLIAYGFQKSVPALFFHNVAREYRAKGNHGSVQLAEAADRLAEKLANSVIQN